MGGDFAFVVDGEVIGRRSPFRWRQVFAGPHLQIVKRAIAAIELEQFVMGALLDNSAVFDEQDGVGMHQRTQAMGDDRG